MGFSMNQLSGKVRRAGVDKGLNLTKTFFLVNAPTFSLAVSTTRHIYQRLQHIRCAETFCPKHFVRR